MQIKEHVNSFRNRDDPDELVFEDGSAYVKRYETIRLGPLDTGLAGRQRWFPVAEEDTDLLVLKAALGGWFGLHRFSQGEISTGLLYALTCGCVGILPAMDIVQYLTGSMHFYRVDYIEDGTLSRKKEKVYLRKPVHKRLAVICIFLAIATGLLAWKILFEGLGGALIAAIVSYGGKGSAVPEWLAEVFRLMTDSFSRKGGW